jgi:hypothetical protein
MIEDRTLRTANRTVAGNENNLIIAARGPIPTDDFELLQRPGRRERSPHFTVISGSAAYRAEPVTIDVTDYAEIKTPAQTAKRTDPFLRSAVGPLLALSAAAVVAVTVSLAPASDGPVSLAGPVSGHSILHFPR